MTSHKETQVTTIIHHKKWLNDRLNIRDRDAVASKKSEKSDVGSKSWRGTRWTSSIPPRLILAADIYCVWWISPLAVVVSYLSWVQRAGRATPWAESLPSSSPSPSTSTSRPQRGKTWSLSPSRSVGCQLLSRISKLGLNPIKQEGIQVNIFYIIYGTVICIWNTEEFDLECI